MNLRELSFVGTWDTGIFDDDVAMDIKAEFDEAIADGMSVKEATEQILESFADVFDDEDEAPIVYLTLAALQIEKGSVLKNIKQKALDIIESGQGFDRWEEAGNDVLNERISVLNELKAKLNK